MDDAGRLQDDLATLRCRARAHLANGAVTAEVRGDSGDRDRLLRRLNEALAIELACLLRYRRRSLAAERNGADHGARRAELEQELAAQRIAIDAFRATVRPLGDADPLAPALLTTLLTLEEEHADDLAGLLDEIPRRAGAKA